MRRDLKLHDTVIAVQGRLLGVADEFAADGEGALLLDGERLAGRMSRGAPKRDEDDGYRALRPRTAPPNAGRHARSACRQYPLFRMV